MVSVVWKSDNVARNGRNQPEVPYYDWKTTPKAQREPAADTLPLEATRTTPELTHKKSEIANTNWKHPQDT